MSRRSDYPGRRDLGGPALDRTRHLGDLQHAIMSVLWDEHEATVAHVHDTLRHRRLGRALTTVATMLSKLEKKGVVTHRVAGRQFVYRPIVSEEEITRSMVADLLRRLFRGDASSLVAHLLVEQELELAELGRLRALIGERLRGEHSLPHIVHNATDKNRP